MTVSATNAFSGPYAGNGATTAFPFTFAAKSTAEVAVYVDGALLASGYTATLNAGGNGGTVTFATAPANGTKVVVASNPSFEQDVAFTNSGPFLADSHDDANDRAAIRDIFLKGRLDRALLAPIGETVGGLPAQADRPGKFLGFDGGGNPVALSGTGADAALRTDLAASTGASLVGFVPATGLTATDLQTALQLSLPLRPEFFGAVGDGVTNDQPAFDALNAKTAALGFAHIELTRGRTYLVGKQIPGGDGAYLGSGKAIDATGLRSLVIRGNGACLKTNPNLKYGRFDPATGLPMADGTATLSQRALIGYIVNAQDVGFVSITDLELDGNSVNQIIGGKTDVSGNQDQHYGLFFRRCLDTFVCNVKGHDFLLDGWLYDHGIGAGPLLTLSDPARPFTMVNCHFYNVGRNCGTIGGGNAITLINVNHKHNGAPISGGGTLTSGPASALDIESTSIIRNLSILRGSFAQGPVGISAMVADSGDIADVILDGVKTVGLIWFQQDRVRLLNGQHFGTTTLSSGSATPAAKDKLVIENYVFSDKTDGDTPLQGTAGASFLMDTDASIPNSIIIRNTRFEQSRLKLALQSVVISDVIIDVSCGTDSFADNAFIMQVDNLTADWLTVNDKITANIPATGYFISGTPTASIRNGLSTLGGKIGWGAVSAGRTGRFDNSDRTGMGKIGYQTGVLAGNAVAQITSKSTGVTLNNVTGKITMNNAALAADTSVPFVLTNANIGATDLIVVNHVSGGTIGAYTITGSITAAGSATITVRNVSTGSLSEAIVLRFGLFAGSEN